MNARTLRHLLGFQLRARGARLPGLRRERQPTLRRQPTSIRKRSAPSPSLRASCPSTCTTRWSCAECDLLYANPAPDRKSLEAAYHDAAFDASEESRYAGLTYGRCCRASRRSSPIERAPSTSAPATARSSSSSSARLHGRGRASSLGRAGGGRQSRNPPAHPPRHPSAPPTSRPRSLRLVTCFQTIEHVHDPLALCRDGPRLLRPGGALFIVCHNRRALSARAHGPEVAHLRHRASAAVLSVKRACTAGTRRVFASRGPHRWSTATPSNYWARLSPIPGSLKPRALDLLRSTRPWLTSRWRRPWGTWPWWATSSSSQPSVGLDALERIVD